MHLQVGAEIIALSPAVQRQLPFAVAKALTGTAQDGQAVVRGELPQRFHLKNSWTQRSIRIVAATKANWTSEVAAPDYMAKQETGGTRTPEGMHLAAPGDSLRGKIIRANQRPGAALSQPRTFKIFGQAGHEAIARRTSRLAFRILYWLTPTQDYEQRFDFGKTVAGVVDQRFPSRFQMALSDALSTAR